MRKYDCKFSNDFILTFVLLYGCELFKNNENSQQNSYNFSNYKKKNTYITNILHIFINDRAELYIPLKH